MNTPDWRRFSEALAPHRRFLISSHVSPDGDSIGSELALSRYLKTCGKESLIINADRLPPFLAFMDTEGCIRDISGFSEPPEADMIIMVDTSLRRRCGRALEGLDLPITAIDHHIQETGSLPGLIMPSASSAGEVLYHFFKAMDFTFTPDVAAPLLYAIGADTGWLRFSNTTPRIFEICAELCRCTGLDPATAYHSLKENWTEERFRLHAAIMDDLELINGQIALITCTQAMLSAYPSLGGMSEATDTFIDDLKRMADPAVFVFIKEKPDNKGFGISLRGRGRVNVQQVAAVFGGGGHANASGCDLEDTDLDTVRARILQAIHAHMPSDA